ncbi:type II toxin-antitoxin system VapC family toxin [Candidatus Gottesmanbacteria bacterium]|nr:type II toxin-antitoxin system VapC family toxin [Candidatus Gottesmanbacteria bacterium]
MIFVDTNYFLRFLLKDNKDQFLEAKELFGKGALGEIQLFTSLVVFFEIYWVLSSFYKKEKSELIKVLTNVLSMGFIKYENAEILFKAVQFFSQNKLDLEDSYNIIYAKESGAKSFKTFDQRLN